MLDKITALSILARKKGANFSQALKTSMPTDRRPATSAETRLSESSSETFPDAVSALQETGLSKGKAIKEAAKKYPSLHATFLQQIKGLTFLSAYKNLSSGQRATGTFEEIVTGLQKKGLSRGKAIKEAARKHPEAHVAYLSQI